MYHPIEVASLSPSQVSKLMKGHPVRVKSGKGHVIHLSSEQLKKHHKASMKGAGHNLMLDPYQITLHGHLMGRGVMSKAKKGVKHVGQFVKAHKKHFRPLVNELKNVANQELAQASQHAIESGLSPELVNYYSELASEKLDKPYNVGGSLKSFSKFMNKPAVKSIRRALKPVGQAAWNTAEDMLLQGIEQAPMMAMTAGMGLKKHRKPRKLKKPVLKRSGGALQVAGYGY
jgi:hypothetical protein